MEKVIILDHISKSGELKDISFTVQKGELVGILGANPSVLKVIAGLSPITSGFVSVLGYDPYKKSIEYLKQIGFIKNQKNRLLKCSSPRKLLEITKLIYNVTDREFGKNISELTQYIKDPELLALLIHKPKLVLIDELNQDLDSIYDYNKKTESTVVITTTKIDRLINFVRRIILIDKGKILFDGAIDDILNKFATEKVVKVKLSSEIDINEVGEIGIVKKYDFPYLYVSAPRSVVSLTASELIQNFPVTSVEIEELPIEEIINNIKS